jgi:hypothetical protein
MNPLELNHTHTNAQSTLVGTTQNLSYWLLCKDSHSLSTLSKLKSSSKALWDGVSWNEFMYFLVQLCLIEETKCEPLRQRT